VGPNLCPPPSGSLKIVEASNPLTLVPARAHNLLGCWSSPLTAHWADNSYEEEEFLGRSWCALP
jgi:hypothetical protein